MGKKVNAEDIIKTFFTETLAFLSGKYKINTYNFIFDKKTYWEIEKPKFYFDMYPESAVDNTIWVMDIFYLKIRRVR